jgi:hypothetical protein
LGFWRSKRKNERRKRKKTNGEGDEFAFIELGRDVSDGKGEDDSEEHDEALVSDEDEEPSVSGCVRVGEASSGTDKVIKSFMFFEFGSGSGDESPEEQDQLLEDEVRSNNNCHQRKKRNEGKTNDDRGHEDDPKDHELDVADDLDCERRAEHSPDSKGLGDQGPVVFHQREFCQKTKKHRTDQGE